MRPAANLRTLLKRFSPPGSNIELSPTGLTDLTWIGLTISGFRLNRLVADGPFSWVYSGENETGSAKAFKVAKPLDHNCPDTTERYRPTQALMVIPGGTTPIDPDPNQLLALQANKLHLAVDDGVVSVDQAVFNETICYVPMELLEGQTLREVMEAGPVNLKLFLELALCLDRLSRNPDFGIHGDIKPENVIVTSTGVKLVDPGYFGPIDCRVGSVDNAIITTPGYYPLLVPDDLLAFGIMLWEAITTNHPLAGKAYTGEMDLTGIDEDLLQLVRFKELVGQYFFVPMLNLRHPAVVLPTASVALQNLLLKALRLQFTAEGKLGIVDGFAGFAEIACELEKVIEDQLK